MLVGRFPANNCWRTVILMVMNPDPFREKGATEENAGNTSLRGQLPHRNEDPLIKSHDSDFPERGENPEHTGEPELASLYLRDEPETEKEDPEGAEQDQDPGHRQKQNQSGEKEDPLAA